jgi:hypothetical protein
MSYTKEDLEAKLLAIYPDIKKYDLSLDLEYDESRGSWILSFAKGNYRRHAFLHRTDADACMEGNMCTYLWALIDQYLKDLETQISMST